MTGKEKALAAIRQNRKNAEIQHRALLDTLRADETFDTLFRTENALKWDFIKARTDEEKNLIEVSIQKNIVAMNNYLSSIGYSEKALTVPYSCKLCNDTGMIDGKECSCVDTIRIALSLQENPLLTSCPFGFNDVTFSYYKEEQGEKEKIARAVEKGLANGKKYFLFAGKPGTGKTFLASAAVKGLLREGRDVVAMNAIKWNKKMLEYHCAPLEGKKSIWQIFEDADVLLIDDLGAEQVLYNVTIPYLLELLTERTDKITFITTNLSPADLEKRYGQRILSRLLDKNLSMPILFEGKDLRF